MYKDLDLSVVPFTLRDKGGWDADVATNMDGGYSQACLSFASHWAAEMERQMTEGKTVEEVATTAEQKMYDQDIGGGITGFQYGCVVSCLSRVWIHGEELRRWHNLRTQLKDEGVRANESGGVLNPALLSIGK